MEQTKIILENLNGELTVLDELKARGISIAAPCGGRGTCNKCKIKLNDNIVLACKTHIAGNAEIELPSDSIHFPGTYDVAVDLGTTNVVARLFNTETGLPVGDFSMPNPQRIYGADVINRIQYCRDGHLNDLHNLIYNQIQNICSIRNLSIAGNTIMQCIYADIDPSPIGVPPFKSPTLFLDDPILLPCVSGYVGGDITAGLTAEGGLLSEGLWLYIDFGTNGEIALGNKDGFLTCSCAAGPAFECHDTLYGSEIIDEIASLLHSGQIGKSGKLKTSCSISQSDIRSIQLAKAAIRAGTEVLLSHVGKEPSAITKLIVSGKFGEYINVENAISIGLIPDIDLSVVYRAGNSALKGASLGLTNSGRQAIRRLSGICSYIELSSCPEFSNLFIKYINF